MMRRIHHLHRLLIPSHRNNYRAKALHLDFLVGLLAVVSLFSAATGFLKEGNVLGFANNMQIDRLFALTNEVRTSQGLPAFRYNDKLAVAAQSKAQHMIANDYWAHFGAGKSPWDFILGAGYSYEVAGENLAKGFKDESSVLRGWENSPTHRANLVRPEYDEVGFAVTNGVLQGEEVTLVVQMFGKQIAQAKTEPQKEDTQIAALETEPADKQESEVVSEEKPIVTPAKLASSGVISQQPAVATPQPLVAGSFISLNNLTLNWTTFIIGFLMTVLTLDLYFAHKLHLIRLTGKNVAHIIFLATLILGLWIIKTGVIL